MHYYPYWMSSDRTLDTRKNTWALREEHSGIAANWWRRRKRQFGRAITAFSFANAISIIGCLGDSAFAQIIPDTTLGRENSRLTSTDTVDRINGGATRGANLFHSFLEFNVSNGRSVFFTNPAGIKNILTRVTGTNASNIFGTLGVTGGNANLFLINPNGIIFGQNARLRVNGSFVATTANAIRLANGDIFSATPGVPLPNQLLNVNPNAFFFNQIAAGPITSQARLQVPDGQSLLLLGGNVNLNGGVLKAPEGRIELGGMAGEGMVGLNVDGNNLSLSFPDGVARADVFLTQKAEVDVSGRGSGAIQVQGRRVTLADASKISANTLGRQDGRGISIQASQFLIQDGSQISASTKGDGQAGNIDVNASDWVELVGSSADGQKPSKMADDNVDEAAGNGGKLTITTRSLIVRDGARLSASSSGRGRAGNIELNALESVELIGTSSDNRRPSGLSVQNRGAGAGGELRITTRALIVRDGAEVSAATYGAGAGGTVIVNASESVEVSGLVTSADGELLPSTLLAQSGGREILRDGDSQPATGKGGDLRITTRQLIVRDGAEVTASGEDLGDAGSLFLNVDSIFLDNKGKLRASTQTREGGNINLQVSDLILMRREGLISANAKNDGNGGNVRINAPFIVAVPSENSDIIADANRGKGGNITITTNAVYGLENRPQLTPLSDINASSQYGVNGTVQINTPGVDPSQGLTNLPSDVVDASNQIDQTCSASGARDREKNRFIITGRGGLPPSPNEPLQAESIVTNWVTLDPPPENRSEDSNSAKPDSSTLLTSTSPAKPALVEAQGWIYGANGEVILTASAPNATPHSPNLMPSQCYSQQ